MEDQDAFGDLPTFDDDVPALTDRGLTPKPETIDLTETVQTDTISEEVVFVESRPRPEFALKSETSPCTRPFVNGESVDLTTPQPVKFEQKDNIWRIPNGMTIDLDAESDTSDEPEESIEQLMAAARQHYQATGGQMKTPVVTDGARIGQRTTVTTEATDVIAQRPVNLDFSSETQDNFSDRAAVLARTARNTIRRSPSNADNDRRRAEEHIKQAQARKAGRGKKRKRSEVEAEGTARLKELLAQDAANRSKPLSDITREDLQRARHVFPPRRVWQNAEEWGLRGLAVKLRHHQLLGSAWMIEREKEGKACKGGILGDEMGFGKTIQSIALMLGNQRESSGPKATLVVCPSNVVHQWSDELTNRINTHPPPSILTCRGKHSYTKEEMEESFCVITSYTMVRRSVGKAWPPDEISTPEEISEWYASSSNFEIGDFHSVKWHRVILDECTAMKNYRTITARACNFLDAEHRWLLSGTPLVNDVRELYSYMLFLGMQPGSIEQFESNFFTTEAAMQRMQHAVSGMMLRRTHVDKLFGKDVIPLPNCVKEDIEFDLTPVEFAVYDVCRVRLASIINDCLRRQNEQEKFRHILEGICRLRQITAHPLLAGETIRNVLTDEDREQIEHAITLAHADQTAGDYAFIRQLRRQLDEANNTARTNATVGATNGPFGASSLNAEEFFETIDGLKGGDAFAAEAALRDSRLALEEECVCCERQLEATGFRLLPCNHVYCGRCIEGFQNNKTRFRRGQCRVTGCNTPFESIEPYGTNMDSPYVAKKQRFVSRENQDKTWIIAADLVPSTKLMAVKAQIQSWLAQDSNTKIIIYTQWRDIVSCLVQICIGEEWTYVTHTGLMSFDAREKSIQDFREPRGGVNIFIATLQTGGIGLNLTCATKVINIDLYWNRGIEDQAFARVWRIGQEHETQCVRLMARGTIDEVLTEMQKEKTRRIERATNDDGSMADIKEADLLKLFGDVAYDNHNSPYIRPVGYRWRYYFGGERGFRVRTPNEHHIAKITKTYGKRR